MSVPSSLVISKQTMLSKGAGASVGLEVAYAPLGGGIGSVVRCLFNLCCADRRNLVGTGTGAGAPPAGAFYALEITTTAC